MKEYQKIVALDFELYNTKHYWSICWAGVYMTTACFSQVLAQYDIKIHPGIRERFIGFDMSFPFSFEQISKEPKFDALAQNIIGILDEDTLVIGHAFENDAKMIIDACKKYGIACPSFDYVDTNIFYNAAKKLKVEHSLSQLASDFGIEFLAHNPLEDARAAHLVIKALCGNMSICEYMDFHAIEAGRVENSLIKKCFYKGCGGLHEKRISSFNQIFELAKTQVGSEAYFFDASVVTGQDLDLVLRAVINDGKSIVSTPYAADFVVTNNLDLSAQSNVIEFKQLVKGYGLPQNKYDYSPKKIRGKDGKSITISDYYNSLYAEHFQSGIFDGQTIAFSKSVENSDEFDLIAKKIVRSGASLCFSPAESSIFLLKDKSELNNSSDGRIRAFRRNKNKNSMTISDFLSKV